MDLTDVEVIRLALNDLGDSVDERRARIHALVGTFLLEFG